jgi:hypothetical protein
LKYAKKNEMLIEHQTNGEHFKVISKTHFIQSDIITGPWVWSA